MGLLIDAFLRDIFEGVQPPHEGWHQGGADEQVAGRDIDGGQQQYDQQEDSPAFFAFVAFFYSHGPIVQEKPVPEKTNSRRRGGHTEKIRPQRLRPEGSRADEGP